ncbi:MAG: orotidine-5'-phosphate decarboxylase [Dehalococcoidia bacterium]
MTFVERISAAAAANRSRLCVGLDPDPSRIVGGDVLAWARAIMAATQDLVCCYKPNSAFFEALGRHGWELLAETIASAPEGIPMLLDAKRGDVGNTAQAYARAVFQVLGADAVTVSPYLGEDSLEPFLSYHDRGVFILCRTSNPGARDLQDLPLTDDVSRQPLYEIVAERARAWNRAGNVGLVTGATYPAEIAKVRAICPDQLLLVPGVGSQGGDLTAAVHSACDRFGGGFLLNASRQVTYASGGADFASAARRTAEHLRAQIEAARLSLVESGTRE